MYRKIHPPRPSSLEISLRRRFCTPRPSRLPSGNLSGLGVQNPRPWEISCASGSVFSNTSLLSAVYGYITLTPVSQAAEIHIPHICLRRYVPPSVTLSHFHSALQTFFDVLIVGLTWQESTHTFVGCKQPSEYCLLFC